MKKLISKLTVALFGYSPNPLVELGNIAEGTHEDGITKLSDVAITVRFLLVKFGTDVDHVAINTANDKPLGICTDEPSAAERECNVNFLSVAKSTRKVVASEAIVIDAELYTAADGKVQNEPAVAGTYYLVGRALRAASADLDVIEMEPVFPIAFVVS